MSAQSGSVTNGACLLLVLLLPLTLAQDNSADCSPAGSPECLPNRLSGTYYIIPEGSENTSCPAQPCLTLTQLRDDFFVFNALDLVPVGADGYYDTAVKGTTSVVFLPGIHTLDNNLDFRGDYTSSFSLTGLNDSAIINCKHFNGLFSVGFKDITITHLDFNKCVVYAVDSNLLLVDSVIFDDTGLYVYSGVDLVNIRNSNIKLGTRVDEPDIDLCIAVEILGVFYIDSSHTNLRNVTFSLLSDPLPCDTVILLGVQGGDLDIADCGFLGKPSGKLIVLINTCLSVSGTVHFDNGNPAIQALSSTINLAGNVSFTNNTAYQGGAMSLSDSRVTIADNAHVIFQGNHADHVGGAIFSTGNDLSNYVSVGLRADSCQISFGVNSRVVFINNTAESGGSAIYGITVSKLVCGHRNQHNSYDNLFESLTFHPDDFSAVSSDPLRVCICPEQSTPDCLAILPDQKNTHLHYTIYHGQNLAIAAAVVGFNFALTSGSVYAKFLNSYASLGSESQYVQGISHAGCSQLQYNVLSDKKQETLVLRTNGGSVAEIRNGIEGDIGKLNENYIAIKLGIDGFPLTYSFENPNEYYMYNTQFVTNLTNSVFRMAGYVPRSLQDTPVFISLTLLDCPPGFILTEQPHECECDERVLYHNLTCNINDQTVHRMGTTWINASFTGNSSNGVIVHKHCPFGYCKQESVDVDLTNPDTQCAFDHSGTLCGACKPNFSLALGSSQCLPNCSNKYLSLLIPFALAGFALVFVIKILNLTVSQGTINGLIFYANIVAANQFIFFPAQYNMFLSFMSVFISWLNLDLGINTCFIKELDGYWKTWLQFVFPFYVWAIAGAIILVSHYSARATKIFGKNSISVLATLFLLSYAKLLRSIINIFCIATLVYPDDSTSAVWAFDGNVQYFSPNHIPLFLFALATVLLLWLPYTAVLLAAQWLRTQTHRKGLHWLKPFLDAYYGPFKDKHHYWVGVLLVVRGVLFVFFASFFAIENNVNLLLVSISSILLSAFCGSLYKNMYLTALEKSFFINLGVLAAGTYHIRLVGGSQEALVTTSVRIAFLQFVGIAAFRSYHFVIVPAGRKWKETVKSKSKDQSYDIELKTVLGFKNDTLKPDEDSNVITHSEVRLSELRREAAQLSPEHCEPHAETKILLSESNTPGNNVPQINLNNNQPSDLTATKHRLQQAKTKIDENTEEILIPLNHDTPHPNIDPLKKQAHTASNKAADTPKKSESESEAATVPSSEFLLPQERKYPL